MSPNDLDVWEGEGGALPVALPPPAPFGWASVPSFTPDAVYVMPAGLAVTYVEPSPGSGALFRRLVADAERDLARLLLGPVSR